MADVERVNERDVEGSMVCFKINTPFIPHRLMEEVSQEHGWKETASCAFVGDPSSASERDPVFVWVPHETKISLVSKVIESHNPTPTPHPLSEIRAKLEHGDAIDLVEINRTLKYLLERVH